MGERLAGAAGDDLYILAALTRAGSLGLYFHEGGSPWAKEFVKHDAHFIKRWAFLRQQSPSVSALPRASAATG